VEQKFEIDRTRGYAVRREAKISVSAEQEFWAEAFNTATEVGNMMYGLKQDKITYEKVYGRTEVEPKES